MHQGSTIFSQIMGFFPIYEFNKCVKRYNGNFRVKSFSCLNQLFVMAFAQLTYRESLRDIEECLRAMRHRLYHCGIRTIVSKTTLADANEMRDWRIYAEFAQVLINIARPLYTAEDIGIEIEEMVYALDSTTIDLCLSLFPWAKFRQNKGAIKLHTLLDIHGPIPTFISISDGKLHDVNILDTLIPEPGAIYLMDRGYIDYERLFVLNTEKAHFITLAKSNMHYQRVSSQSSDINQGVLFDQTIQLSGIQSAKDYPEKLRLIHYYDKEEKRHIYFLTNNFKLSAVEIAALYKKRWCVEIFFKWIKQNLRIKKFYGTSENAVKTQIWIAISIYLVAAIIKKKLKIEKSLYTFLQIVNISIFEKMPLNELFSEYDTRELQSENCNQLNLFDL
jgi:hypothetical protein